MPKNALILKGADFSANKVTTITISTEDKPCTGIVLDQSTITVAELGNTTLTATVTPADTTDDVIWTTSDASVATVANGIVSVVGLGTATITATCGEQTATCAVTCNEITISPYFAFAKRSNSPTYPNVFFLATSKRELLIADEVVSGRRTLRNGTSDASLSSCPILMPENTGIVELSYGSDMRAGTIVFGWFNTAEAGSENYPDCAYLDNVDTTNSSAYNQPKTWQYEVPEGVDSFAIIVTTTTTDYTDSDTPSGIAMAKEIVVKCKPAA